MNPILEGFNGKVLIDGDILVYRAAFACKDQEEFFALHSAKTMLLAIAKLFPKSSGISLYLSEEGKNYRHYIAKHVPYKGNRGAKPDHYKVVREYFINEWDAKIAPGVEADDAIGWATEDSSCVVSIDKDLLMLPGFHYNFVTETFLHSSDPGKLHLDRSKTAAKLIGTGFKWFCAQMLLGDTADNIKGLYRVGPVKTYRLLNRIKEPKRLWRTVRYLYKKHGLPKTRLHENAQLLWIQREPGQKKPVIDGVPLWREKYTDTKESPTAQVSSLK